MEFEEFLRVSFKWILVLVVAAFMLIYVGFTGVLIAAIDKKLYDAFSAAMGTVDGSLLVVDSVRKILYQIYPYALPIIAAIVVAAGALWMARR